mmetsp:Transcript_2742/g.17095  ORF Transcript_2742/g.17095 Transcript_2742/m.17095 type:complete len:197 (+) Transcript_2742:1250-1840(+)
MIGTTCSSAKAHSCGSKRAGNAVATKRASLRLSFTTTSIGRDRVLMQDGTKRHRTCACNAVEDDKSPDEEVETLPWDEKVYYEGKTATSELVVSLLLGVFVLYLPLTAVSIGRYLWQNYKFTNRRVLVLQRSPFSKKNFSIFYKDVVDVVTIPRCLGLWGDMILTLKDGAKVTLVALDDYTDLRDYVAGFVERKRK